MADLSLVPSKPKRAIIYCSFCGKAEHEVLVLIAGPAVWICDECSDLVAEIVREKRPAPAQEGKV